MLQKDRQQKHFNEIWAAMLRHLQAFYTTQKPEDLHQFRVQVKKIEALLFFLQNPANETENDEALQPLRSLYKRAGQIRTAQIHAELAGKYDIGNAVFKTGQEKRANAATKRFCSTRGSVLKQLGRAHRALGGSFHDLKGKAVRRLYKKRLKKLGNFFADPGSSPDDMHKNRKRIKRLLYLHEALPPSIVKKLRLDTRYLDKMQHAIGKWHDVAVILELLKTKELAALENGEQLEKRSRSKHAAILSLSKGFDKKVSL